MLNHNEIIRKFDNLNRQAKRQNKEADELLASLKPIDENMRRTLALLNGLDDKLKRLKEFDNNRND